MIRYFLRAGFCVALYGAALVVVASSCSDDDNPSTRNTGPVVAAGSGGEDASSAGGSGGGSSAGGSSAGGVSAGGAGGEPVDPTGPLSAQEALDAFVAETGHTFTDCGDLECAASWTLPLDAGTSYVPGAEDEAAVSCFLDAWASCTPAVIDAFLPCIDCPNFHVLSYVVPTGNGCKLVEFTDWSDDPLGDCSLFRDDCTELLDYTTTMLECPWFGKGSCETSVALRNEGCGAR